MEDRYAIVYGHRCPAHEQTRDETIEGLKNAVAAAREGETIKFISGEAQWELFNACEKELRAGYERGVRYQMVTGPVVSVEKDDGGNAILGLAKEGMLDLWLSKVRRKLHMTIVGDHLLRGEMPHPPASKLEDRLAYELDVNDIEDPKEKEHAQWAIRQRIREFDSLTFFSDRVKPNRVEDQVMALDNETIAKVDEEAHERGREFNLLTKDDIAKLLQEVEEA